MITLFLFVCFKQDIKEGEIFHWSQKTREVWKAIFDEEQISLRKAKKDLWFWDAKKDSICDEKEQTRSIPEMISYVYSSF